jgi:hypothetical protein
MSYEQEASCLKPIDVIDPRPCATISLLGLLVHRLGFGSFGIISALNMYPDRRERAWWCRFVGKKNAELIITNQLG